MAEPLVAIAPAMLRRAAAVIALRSPTATGSSGGRHWSVTGIAPRRPSTRNAFARPSYCPQAISAAATP